MGCISDSELHNEPVSDRDDGIAAAQISQKRMSCGGSISGEQPGNAGCIIVAALLRGEGRRNAENVPAGSVSFGGRASHSTGNASDHISRKAASGALEGYFCNAAGQSCDRGMIYVCREWICRWRSPGIWMVFAGAAGVFLVLFVMERYLRHGEKRVNTMDGIIGLEDGRRYPLRLLLDTGNCLVSPYSGERVMIMAQSLALKLKIAEQKRPLMIPYHSIGGDGVLPAYRIPLLILQDGSVIRNFLAAVSPQLSEDSAVQLIMYGRR